MGRYIRMPIWCEDKELSKYSRCKAKMDLTKIGQVASMLASLACSLGFCWGELHSLACACVGFACIFGQRESRVVMVMTPPTLAPLHSLSYYGIYHDCMYVAHCF